MDATALTVSKSENTEEQKVASGKREEGNFRAEMGMFMSVVTDHLPHHMSALTDIYMHTQWSNEHQNGSQGLFY